MLQRCTKLHCFFFLQLPAWTPWQRPGMCCANALNGNSAVFNGHVSKNIRKLKMEDFLNSCASLHFHFPGREAQIAEKGQNKVKAGDCALPAKKCFHYPLQIWHSLVLIFPEFSIKCTLLGNPRDFDFLPPSEGLWIVGWRWHPRWGWHPSLTDAAPQLVLRVGVITNIVIITINGEMSVMIKVGMCQCQNPTIHYKLQRQQLALVTCSTRPQC